MIATVSHELDVSVGQTSNTLSELVTAHLIMRVTHH